MLLELASISPAVGWSSICKESGLILHILDVLSFSYFSISVAIIRVLFFVIITSLTRLYKIPLHICDILCYMYLYDLHPSLTHPAVTPIETV